MKKLFQVLTAVIVSLQFGPLLGAGPSTDAPQATLSTRPQALSERLVLDAQRLSAQADEELQRYEKNFAEGRYKEAVATEMKRISGTYVKVRQHQRAVRQLVALREPAGLDMEMRNADLQASVGEIIRKYKELPGAGTLIGKAELATRNLAKSRAKLLESLERPLEQGKLDSVERRLYELWDEVELSIVWQGRLLPDELRGPFLALEKQMAADVAEARRVQAVELINQLRTTQSPPFSRFLDNVDSSVESVAKTGSAPWGGQTRDGAELITAWMVGWRQAHVMSLRAQALTWSLPEDTTLDPPDTLAKDYADFHARMIAACAALVEADAARVDAADAPDLYARYLAAFAQTIPRMSDDSLRSAVEPALAKLRNKSPEFAQTVDAYERATSQALLWRQRKSEAWRREQEATDTMLEKLLEQAAQPEAMVARTGKDAQIDTLLVAAPLLVQDVAQVAANKSAVIEALSPDDKTPVCNSRLRGYFFGQAAKVEVPLGKIDDLKADLLISPAAPPLTLDAAIAVATAEQGHFAAIGGSVRAIEVDSRLGRVMNLEDDAILPVGALLNERTDDPLTELVWRVELTPKWAQHKYFFMLAP